MPRAFEFYSVSPELLQRPQMQEALRNRDFRTAFGLMRQYDGASQERIASVVEGLTQGRVSRVMSGRDRLVSLELIERVADGLRIPGELLGLAAREWEHDQVDGLIVLTEHAELYYDGKQYRVTIRRRLHNVSSEPVTRFLIRIAVDKYPDDHKRSNEFYRADPLTFDELNLSARCGSEEMNWTVDHDRDAAKEIWLLFGNALRRFPIQPGSTADIVYSFTISDSKWGDWFERAIRLPTQQLTVTLKFPRSIGLTVWGTVTSLSTDAAPIRNQIAPMEETPQRTFQWKIDKPRINARYRLEWRKAQSPGSVENPSSDMASAGIVQRGEAILERPAKPLDLPAESEVARQIVSRLHAKAQEVRRLHEFTKGMGIAAPQIGVDRAVAIILPREGEAITLLNPRVVDESAETDTQYEGCLSFFDVRGEVTRPRRVAVEHCDLTGKKHITMFDDSVARLISHEIDHLNGTLYTERMASNTAPIPVSQYAQGGRAWEYQG